MILTVVGFSHNMTSQLTHGHLCQPQQWHKLNTVISLLLSNPDLELKIISLQLGNAKMQHAILQLYSVEAMQIKSIPV